MELIYDSIHELVPKVNLAMDTNSISLFQADTAPYCAADATAATQPKPALNPRIKIFHIGETRG